MPHHDTETLLRRLIGGDASAAATILARAGQDSAPRLLVAAALLADEPGDLITRAGENAVSTRDRQLVALAAAHLDDDRDRFDALVRDHLSGHPDNLLAAWIAARHSHTTTSQEL
jgi:predicted HD phosphohydrolase